MLNRIIIMGRLTRDPELRSTTTGTSVTSFTLAVDRDVADSEGNRKADFIDCVAWNKGAEFVEKHFKKGSMAIVSGRLQIREWTDKDGNKRRTAEVIAEHTYFGESKPREVSRADRYDDDGSKYGHEKFTEQPNDDGELPF
jgi:single-strand DNA-binding protein